MCGLGEILGEGEEGRHRVGGGLDCLFGLIGCFLLLGLGGGVCLFGGDCGGVFVCFVGCCMVLIGIIK